MTRAILSTTQDTQSFDLPAVMDIDLTNEFTTALRIVTGMYSITSLTRLLHSSLKLIGINYG